MSLRDALLAAIGRQFFRDRLLAKTTPWAHVHRAADKYRPQVQALTAAAFEKGRAKASRLALKRALEHKSETDVLSIASGAITATQHALSKSLEPVLFDTMVASATATAKVLKRHLKISAALRSAAPNPKIKGFEFDATNPQAVEWIKQHAADTIDSISETTRQAIRDAVEAAFEDQFDVDQLAGEIEDVLGDGSGDRAEEIARTETMRASNEGQQALWDQAVDDGLLTGTEEQVWIVTPDDRLCPICEPLEDERAPLDGTFTVDGEEIDGPPAHPNCRCVLGLVAAGE